MPPKLEIWTPVDPYHLNQAFGSNSAYYARFLDAFGNPEKGHMGVDLQAAHGQPVYAPVAGDAFYVKDSHGGDGFYIRSQGFTVILWHLCSKDDPLYKPLIPCDGSITKVRCGQLIAYADNTGAPFESSGDHLHVGLFINDPTGAPLNPGNGFGGCIDPLPFFNMKFAKDYEAVSAIVTETSEVISAIQSSPATPSQKSAWYAALQKVVASLLTFFQK